MYDCATEPGLSGAGLFTENGKLVALHVGRKNGHAVAVPMLEVLTDSQVRLIVDIDFRNFATEQRRVGFMGER